MKCTHCGLEVGKAAVCPNCGMDLSVFQKARRLSNSYYNRGLEQAVVRDLSGAIESLKKSLKFNKYNTDARNLLGLVYYEIGEVVAALTEWVISKNYQPEDNLAEKYLGDIQDNPQHLQTINQTIKKYNQALMYCRQDSRDLAIIQLKKVLSLNGNLVKAHQLLALLYIQENKLELAKKTLRTAAHIDTDNTLTLRYLKEVNAMIKEQQSNKKKSKNPEDDLISYQSGNETIIMPKRIKETSLAGSIGYVVIGLVIGVAATAFLVVPNVRRVAMSEANKQLVAANETIAENNQTISNLEKQIEKYEEAIDNAAQDSQSVQKKVDSYENLLQGYLAFEQNDVLSAGKYLNNVDSSHLSEASLELYTTMMTSINDRFIRELFNDGYAAYNTGDYDTAIEDLLAVVTQDENYSDGYAAYYLAQAYRRNDDLDSAQPYYRFVVENYPGTDRAKTAQNYLD